MCKREKGLSDDKILAKYYNFSHFSVIKEEKEAFCRGVSGILLVIWNIFGDQGSMERNFWEQGNSVKVNFGEHLTLFWGNKGTTVNFQREQENMQPPPPRRPSFFNIETLVRRPTKFHFKKLTHKAVINIVEQCISNNLT